MSPQVQKRRKPSGRLRGNAAMTSRVTRRVWRDPKRNIVIKAANRLIVHGRNSRSGICVFALYAATHFLFGCRTCNGPPVASPDTVQVHSRVETALLRSDYRLCRVFKGLVGMP